MAGHIFENFVVSEILKSFLNYGKNLDNIFYYRDKDQKDAFAEAGNRVVILNPAVDNYFHSRSWYIIDENFDLAYEKAGIK